MLISSGETGLDAIRSNYFTLAKWLLLVARAQWYCVHKGLRLIEQGKEREGSSLGTPGTRYAASGSIACT